MVKQEHFESVGCAMSEEEKNMWSQVFRGKEERKLTKTKGSSAEQILLRDEVGIFLLRSREGIQEGREGRGRGIFVCCSLKPEGMVKKPVWVLEVVLPRKVTSFVSLHHVNQNG